MKKIALIFAALIALLILIPLLVSIFRKPIDSVVGCYQQQSVVPHDAICLYEDGSYKQFLIGSDGTDEPFFNEGSWRSYSVNNENGSMIGVTVSDYFDKFGDSRELDIFPYKTLLGKIEFVTSGSDVEKERFYVRRN